ncbi:MAG: hypothetical protein IT372_10120 [Polyangiaceae bacterium]|nr:hypothetical protein [Polyangiaceae bacterium]
MTNRIAAPCELVALSLGVDAETVRLAPAPPRADAPAVVAELMLPPGEHTVRARASVRCGSPDGALRPERDAAPETLVVEAERVLRMDRPVTITADLSSLEAAPRIAVRLSAQGGVLIPEAGVADRDLVCLGARKTRKALCRAEADLAAATARKDVAWALCVRDHLGALRAASDLYEAVEERADPEALFLAAARLTALSARVERCATSAVSEADPPLTVRAD